MGDAGQGYARLVEERFGLRLSSRHAKQLEEAVPELVSDSGYHGAAELYVALAGGRHPELVERLAAALTVGETHFFRVRPQMEALRRVVLPELIARRAGDRALSVWSAGCSTGEEPYTVAMLLLELVPFLEQWKLQLLATDLNRSVLEVARHALYGEWSFRDTPDAVRRSFFDAEGERWRLRESVRRMVRFACHNLMSDPPPLMDPRHEGFDLILCRNVTIYFGPEAVLRLYARFAEALAPGGWLVLGPSDPTPVSGSGLELHELQDALLWRRGERPGASRDLSDGVAGSSRQRVSPQSGVSEAAARGDDADLREVWPLAHAGNRVDARRRVEAVLGMHPLRAEAHLLLGMLHLENGAAEEALASLRRATFLSPDLPMAHFGLGRAVPATG